MTNSTAEKVRENRLRRAAQRQGLELRKSPRRDPRALDYGTWLVVNPRSGSRRVELANIDAVQAYLEQAPDERDAQ
jgi:hypothetical protein